MKFLKNYTNIFMEADDVYGDRLDFYKMFEDVKVYSAKNLGGKLMEMMHFDEVFEKQMAEEIDYLAEKRYEP